MRRVVFSIALYIYSVSSFGQSTAPAEDFTTIAKVEFTPVKNQANSGTCWSFSAISLLESQALKAGTDELDLSEMFIVRNIYIDKAKNYLFRQGAAQFGTGGLGHDVINAIDRYGVVPEGAYSGLLLGSQFHDDTKLYAALKTFLDSLIKVRPVPENWLEHYQEVLDEHLGKAPSSFTYREKVYTPQTFAAEVLKFKKSDFVNLTSFTHHPYYTQFALEVPDNYASELYYNIKLSEMMALVESALKKGYSVIWDTDISNPNFTHKEGYAMQYKDGKKAGVKPDPDGEESPYDINIRQQLFENLTTQDDHLLHIVGIEKSKTGKKFYVVKNSWGQTGPFKGIVRVSEAYFAINTVSIVIPVAALDSELKGKLNLR